MHLHGLAEHGSDRGAAARDVKASAGGERDGKRVKRGKAVLKAGPQEAQPLKVRLPRMKKPGEYRIFFESYAACAMPLQEAINKMNELNLNILDGFKYQDSVYQKEEF